MYSSKQNETAGILCDMGRALFGTIFIVHGLVHLMMTFSYPQYYVNVAALSIFQIYSDLIIRFIVPNTLLFDSFFVAFELVTGIVILLGKRQVVKLGLAAATIFLIVITPAVRPYAFTNALFAVIVALLLVPDYDISALQAVLGNSR